jgi:acylphosphatase
LSAIIARRCFVAGRVQGVFYRASTRQRAQELGCRGYAHNLPDGRVEVLAVASPLRFTLWSNGSDKALRPRT